MNLSRTCQLSFAVALIIGIWVPVRVVAADLQAKDQTPKAKDQTPKKVESEKDSEQKDTSKQGGAKNDGGQQDVTKKVQAKPGDAGKKKDLLDEWGELSNRKLVIARRLRQLQGSFAAADHSGKLKIRDEFQKLVEEWDTTIRPRMAELSLAILERKPDDTEAARLALETNNYAAIVELTAKLMSNGQLTGALVNLAGVANFAIHNFEKAQQILEQGQEKDLLDRVGKAYLKLAGEYIGLWKKEQEIRAGEAAAKGDDQLPIVELKTSRGVIVVELFENEAPNTVANFISLVENKTYDGTAFHRVIPNFMVQGGDPKSRDENATDVGTGGPGYTIKCECYLPNARLHFRGSLSMAHAGKDTGGSQFFITHRPTAHLNPDAAAGRGHTVFGYVKSGMDVVGSIKKGDRIIEAKVLRKRNHEYKPVTSLTKKPGPSEKPGF